VPREPQRVGTALRAGYPSPPKILALRHVREHLRGVEAERRNAMRTKLRVSLATACAAFPRLPFVCRGGHPPRERAGAEKGAGSGHAG
jgi:hypothetical protein